MAESRAHWQLPLGVPRGTWEYGTSDAVTAPYDDDFAEHPLFALDQAILERWSPAPAGNTAQSNVAVDLGCGTGRACMTLARKGIPCLAVDLSERMLDLVAAKAAAETLPIQCLRANLVELDCIADGSCNLAVSLFSTLGMIRGRQHRLQSLKHVQRILRPDGTFVLHVHNFWYNLYDPGGPWWLIRNVARSLFVRDIEIGDKFFTFRDVAQMFLHVFRPGELRRDLKAAGLSIVEWHGVDVKRKRFVKWPWLFGDLRAIGWIIVCQRQ